MVVFICRVLGWTTAAFPLTLCIVIHGFERFYGPPGTDEPLLSLASSTGQTARADDAPKSGWVVDDAGRACRIEEVQGIELRVEPGPDAQGGHVALATSMRVIGFRARHHEVSPYDYLNPFAPPVEGIILDDSARLFPRALVYRAAPETVRLLESEIDLRASDGYQLGNWGGGRNCATWAQDRLRAAGLTPPPGDCPNRLAWYVPLRPAKGFVESP